MNAAGDMASISRLVFDTPLARLTRAADLTRRRFLGGGVHLRGIIEFSNHCCRGCLYCGLRAGNTELTRYRMKPQEVADLAVGIFRTGVRTVVLQSGDDLAYCAGDIAWIVRAIKKRADMAVTLSVGERPGAHYEMWRAAGADRYLMKHETANARQYRLLHLGKTLEERLDCLRTLKSLGYEVGTGFIVGLPGQTREDLAADVALVRALGADMCGVGPFVPQADTPLAGHPPGDVEATLRMVAALRLLMPRLHLPATTALATLSPGGQEDALRAGADVLMPNFTPPERRRHYRIYDHKARVGLDEARRAVAQAGRTIGHGQGGRIPCARPQRACACT